MRTYPDFLQTVFDNYKVQWYLIESLGSILYLDVRIHVWYCHGMYGGDWMLNNCLCRYYQLWEIVCLSLLNADPSQCVAIWFCIIQ